MLKLLRRVLPLFLLPTVLSLAAIPAGAGDPGKLIVHEWGTFTTFSGSDGVHLDFRPLQDNELPFFVANRATQAGTVWFGKGRIRTRVRMETPVTYFYTDTARTVKAKVAFPKGLLTEFYPPVRSQAPVFNQAAGMGQEGEPVGRGMLDWGEIDLLPLSALRPAGIDSQVAEQIARHVDTTLPPDAGSNPYAAARRTDSALVHVRLTPPAPAKAPSPDYLEASWSLAPRGDFYEKFLFYRGVGKFQVPIQVENPAGDRFVVTNTGTEPLPRMLVLRVQGDIRKYSFTTPVAAGRSLELPAPQTEVAWDDLRSLVAQELIATGLYEKEALAMVDTWSSSWFTEQGLRVFYLVPQKLTDEVLPLTIEPRPDEQLRVMVGRVEIMTASQEKHLLQLVKNSASERERLTKFAQETQEQAALPAIPEELLQMGRFAEPALARVRETSRDHAVEIEVNALLWQLKQLEQEEKRDL